MNTNTMELNLNEMGMVNGGAKTREQISSDRAACGTLIGIGAGAVLGGIAGGPGGVFIGGFLGGFIGVTCAAIYDCNIAP